MDGNQPLSLRDTAANTGSCLLVLIALGIALLVGAAILLWAWRTVFQS